LKTIDANETRPSEGRGSIHWQRITHSAIVWNFLAVGLRAGSAIVLLPLLTRKLPPAHLGLWHVFGSIGNLVLLLDFGFSLTLSRAVAYLWAGSERLLPFGCAAIPESSQTSSTPNFPLLGKLIRTMQIYYWILAGVALIILAGAGGAVVWKMSESLPDRTYLRTAWLVFALGSCLNLAGGLWTIILMGINRVRESQQIFVAALLVNYGISISGLLLDFGLMAMVLGTALMGIILRFGGRAWVWQSFSQAEGLRQASPSMELLKVLWPNAWRTGLTSLGLYLTLSANTVVCSALLGLVTTASYGTSLTLSLLIVQVSSAWLHMKLPAIAQARARGEDKLILRRLIQGTRIYLVLYALGAFALVWSGNWILKNIVHARTLLLPAGQMITLVVIIGLAGHQALYRELVVIENQNPFVKPTLISGILVVLFACILTPILGLWGLLLSHGLVELCFNNWWPVLKGIQSLGVKPRHYWHLFFCARIPIVSAHG
jgi:O-antigen/teichoic acid export membrane protein